VLKTTRLLIGTGLALGAIALTTTTARATESQQTQELKKLHWAVGQHALADSHGTFTAPQGVKAVTGSEARHADDVINGTSGSDSEAVAMVSTSGDVLYLTFVSSGFVTADDWKEVDAPKMLQDIRDATDGQNEERKKNGQSGLQVDGWVQEPRFDAARHSVVWILKLHEDNGGRPFLNATALALGRDGYERFVLAADADNPAKARSELNSLVGNFSYNKGSRWTDHLSGDKLAGFGIAALVGTVAGATIAKTVGFGALLLLLKKFFVLIVAAVIGAIAWLRKRLTPRPLVPPPPPMPPAA